MKKIIAFLSKLGFWPYVISFTILAVIISELLILLQSYWLTGNFFDTNLLIVGFITPLIDAFFVILLSAFLIRYLISLQKDLEETTIKLNESNKQLQEQQDKYKNFMNLASNGIFILNEEGKLLEYSNQVKILLAYSDNELKNLYVYDWDISHTKDEAIEHVKNTPREPLNFETKHKRKDGTIYDASITVVKINLNGINYIYASVRDITQQKQAQKELITSKERTEKLLKEQTDLLALFDKGDSVLFKWNNDEEWSIDYVSDNASRLLEYSKDDFLSKHISYTSCIYKEDLERVSKEVADAIENNLDFLKHEPYRILTKSSQVKWIMDYTILQKDQTGSITHFIGYIADITEQKLKNEELQNKLQKFMDTQNNIVLLSNGETIIFSNKTFLNFFGYDNLEKFLEDYNCICDLFIENNNFFHLGRIKENEATWIESLLNLSGRARIVSMLDTCMVPHAFSVSINKYDDESYILSFTDISDTMTETLELKKEATVDALTDVYNRVYFNKHIHNILELHKKNQMNTGIIFFDIDHFKKVNDTYGHDIGDYVLKKIAFLIKEYTRHNDKVIRWGGEEFIIVCEVNTKIDLQQMAEHLRLKIETFEFQDVHSVTSSLGCAMHSNEDEISQTIREADKKLYMAKANGRNRVEC